MARKKIIDLSPTFPLLSKEQEIIVNTPQGVQSLSDFVGGQSINTPVKVNQNHIESSDFETGTTGWRIESSGNVEFNSGTFRGTLTAGQLHIPDQDTTANSFHANSSGDTWWGATETNFNADNNNATAYVLKSGVAKFQNVDVTGVVTINSGSGIANLSDAGALAVLNTVGTAQIDALAVNDTKIAANAVSTAKIATDAVTQAKIAALAVGSNELAAGAVIAGKITAGTIVTGDIASNTITAANIAALTITASELATDSVTAAKIVAGTITTTEIAANTIVAGDISAGTITTTEIAANTITASNIAASTITATEMNVSTLSAITADLGSITAGTIVLPSGGFIRSGQTAYDTGTGFYLGSDAGTPKFSIGDSAGSKITWDGSSLDIVGGQKVSKRFINYNIAITKGETVYLSEDQQDGGIIFDSNIEVKVNSTAFTVGNNNNRILIVGIGAGNGDEVTGVTYNGVALTFVNKINRAGSDWQYIYYLIAPATGSNTLTVSGTTGDIRVTAYSFYNVKQTGQPDNSVTNSGTDNNPTSSITPVADGSIAVMFIFVPTVNTGTRIEMNNFKNGNLGGAGTTLMGGNSAIKHPVGSITQSLITTSGSFTWSALQLTLAPFTTFKGVIKATSALTIATSDSFIGIANENIPASTSSTESVGEVIIAGVVSGLTSLTIGSQYYLSDTTGAISTTAGTVTRKVGISVSSTEILITNVW